MTYAFDEFWPILSGLPKQVNDQDPRVRYLCALVAELTYYHVPALEFDGKKRAMVLPCLGWRDIHRAGRVTNVGLFLDSTDFEKQYFIVVERNVIAVGIFVQPYLFIGFRGTRFWFDWRINLKSNLVPVTIRSRGFGRIARSTMAGMIHQGFASEALRISLKIIDELRKINIENLEHVFITGHSLGGAVAALAERYIIPASTVLFGAPRYCDLAAYASCDWRVPTQVRRAGDLVPSVPPLGRGYSDHPYQFDTLGNAIVDPYEGERWASMALKWASFVGRAVEPHAMDGYRRELGITAGAKYADQPLAPYEKLMKTDISH